ncbi:hypothetical protein DFQ28_007372 [Apophysomyces sp. BC1034]|nr:hypothetical protein DFQ30_009987 [Apophysomyces sp. BC1015]KAG0183175.1 hypothetical protein DFQ29_009251 [Apophysomyces sp. BC1021]KAG0186751.1 hypothetical protein DFQ28_007372 [Apophysomyces sp. BC1034]
MTTEKDAQSKAHLLPFSVDLEGPVAAQQYLNVESTEDNTKTTILLGRKLVGRNVNLPCEGHIWRPDHDNEDRWVKTGAPISEFVLWKKDRSPDENDARLKAMEGWFDIAEAIHEPIPLPS